MSPAQKPELNRFPSLGYDYGDPNDDGRSPSEQPEDRLRGSADMDVNGIGSVHSSYPIQRSQPTPDVSKAAETTPISTADQVEISSAGRLLDQAVQTSGLRAERLEQIKAAIDAGTYDTDEKLEAALERLLDEIGFSEKRL